MAVANLIPVVVFAYNRADLLRLLIESLKHQGIPLLYVFCDSAKSAEDAIRVREVYDVVEAIDWCPKIVHQHKSNLGLGKSVKFGVSQVLKNHKSAIIFEDDLICVDGTYNYLCSALKRYENEEKVMSVTGWTHPSIIPDNVESMPYFDGKSECWGWGTWDRAWVGMEKTALEIFNECRKAGLDLEKYGTDMPKMAIEAEQKNLWAVGWWYLHLLKNGLCLRPPHSLIETTGWDGRGSTVKPSMKFWRNPPLKRCPPIPIDYPQPFEHNDCANLWKTVTEATTACQI